eukprot:1144507-Pelagomonas_calceolata.AAC.1
MMPVFFISEEYGQEQKPQQQKAFQNVRIQDNNASDVYHANIPGEPSGQDPAKQGAGNTRNMLQKRQGQCASQTCCRINWAFFRPSLWTGLSTGQSIQPALCTLLPRSLLFPARHITFSGETHQLIMNMTKYMYKYAQARLGEQGAVAE